MERIVDNITKVRGRIQQAARQNGRDEKEIRLLAVAKSRTASEIREAWAAGLGDFGENYLQEANPKRAALADLPLTWHFIGPLQSNKSAAVAEGFDWLHSLDRPKLAERLSRQRPTGLPPLNVCIQVNIDAEASKAGLEPSGVPDLAREIVSLPGLSLRGLMAIPDPKRSRDQLECSFRAMHALYCQLQSELPSQRIDTLSMGMSADLELAIACGSTLVRVGTDIFGPRNPTT